MKTVIQKKYVLFYKALKDMWFAYVNKDADFQHQFEIKAVQEAEALLGPWNRAQKMSESMMETLAEKELTNSFEGLPSEVTCVCDLCCYSDQHRCYKGGVKDCWRRGVYTEFQLKQHKDSKN